jgi:hypothetical protein
VIAMRGQPLTPPATPKRYRPSRGRLAMKQADIRRRRRAYMPIVHDGGWSLNREIAEVAGPMAARIAARPMPLQFRRQVLA